MQHRARRGSGGFKNQTLCMRLCVCACVHVHVCVYCTYRPIIHTHGMCQRSIVSIFIGLTWGWRRGLCFRAQDLVWASAFNQDAALCELRFLPWGRRHGDWVPTDQRGSQEDRSAVCCGHERCPQLLLLRLISQPLLSIDGVQVTRSHSGIHLQATHPTSREARWCPSGVDRCPRTWLSWEQML